MSTLGFDVPSTWVQFEHSPTLAVFADSSNIESTTSGGQIVWLRFDYRTPQHLTSLNLTFDHTIIHTEVECKTRRAMDLRATLYANHTPVNDETFSAPAWHPFDGPGIGPHVYDPLCAWLARRSH